MRDSFIRAAKDWSRNLRIYFVDSYAESDRLWDGEVPEPREDTAARLEEKLKDEGIVPKDAYLVAYCWDIQKDGIALKFVHPSFPKLDIGCMIEEVGVPRLRKEEE